MFQLYQRMLQMFPSAQRIPAILKESRKCLQTHIHNQGLIAIKGCGDSARKDPRVYMTTIIEFHKKYSALVGVAFNNDPKFVAGLNKIFDKVNILYIIA